SRGGGPAVGTRETIVGALWNGCNCVAGGRYFCPTPQPTTRAKGGMQIYTAGFSRVFCAFVGSPPNKLGGRAKVIFIKFCIIVLSKLSPQSGYLRHLLFCT